jgi:hypothetical protein
VLESLIWTAACEFEEGTQNIHRHRKETEMTDDPARQAQENQKPGGFVPEYPPEVEALTVRLLGHIADK